MMMGRGVRRTVARGALSACGKGLFALAVILGGTGASLAQQPPARPPSVRVWEGTVVIPTYAMGADDFNPHFRETRRLQPALP